jgi:hypothetical protein
MRQVMTVLEGALLLLAGILIGIRLGRLPPRRKVPKPVQAVCGCTHHYAMHDPKTGKCNAAVAVDKYSRDGSWIGNEHKPCACLRYSGPEPLPTYYSPEIATEDSP